MDRPQSFTSDKTLKSQMAAAGYQPESATYLALSHAHWDANANEFAKATWQITLDRYPTFEYNKEQTRQARANIQAFMKQSGAKLWIQHDLGCIREAQEGARLLRVIRRYGGD